METHFPLYDKFYVIESDDEDLPEINTMDPVVKGNIEAATEHFLEENEEFINEHLILCDDYLENAIEQSMTTGDEIDAMASYIEKEIEQMRKDLYEPFRNRFTSVGTMDIPIEIPEIPTVIKTEKDADVIAVKSTVCSTPFDLPKEGNLKYPHLRIGQSLYGVRFSLKQPWSKCDIKNIVDDCCFHVCFDNQEEKFLTRKEIAFFFENPVRFPVGSRVIAKFSDLDTAVVSYFYAGIIAEPPKLINGFR